MAGQFLNNLRRIFRPVLVVWLAVAVTGCSLGFIYPRLDTLAGWQLDRYLRLDSGQERWLDERLEERLGWHQREQLPQWQQALQSLRQDIADGNVDAVRYQQHDERAQALVQASLSGLLDDTVQLAMKLTDSQVQHLLDNLDEDTEELQQELAERQEDPADWERERFDNLVEAVEEWLGRTNEEQRTFLQQWQQHSIRWSDYALNSRQRWRQFLVDALAQRHDKVAVQAAVETLLLHPERLRSEAYQAAVQQQRGHRQALHLYLLQNLTPKQKAHLLDELDDLLEDLTDLLAENAAAAT